MIVRLGKGTTESMATTANTPGQHGQSHVTLQSIAEQANVHVSTVSRALDPNPTRPVSAETVEKVRAIARKLGYDPNPWARSLRTNRTRTLGLVIPRLVDNVLTVIFEAAESTALRLGYQAITVSTGDDPARTRNGLRVLRERRVDGLIVATAHLNDPTIDDLTERNMAFVLLNRGNGTHPCYRADDELGAYLATRHLLERGHHRIAHVAGIRGTSTAADRRAGYLRALNSAGIAEDGSLILDSELGIDSGIESGRALLTRAGAPTAIFAANDYIAIGLMAAARDLGLRVPEDVAIVGYNDTRIGEALWVPLTSVSIPLTAMGTRAVESLIDLIEGRPIESEVFTPQLRVRASSEYRRGPSLLGDSRS